MTAGMLKSILAPIISRYGIANIVNSDAFSTHTVQLTTSRCKYIIHHNHLSIAYNKLLVKSNIFLNKNVLKSNQYNHLTIIDFNSCIISYKSGSLSYILHHFGCHNITLCNRPSWSLGA